MIVERGVAGGGCGSPAASLHPYPPATPPTPAPASRPPLPHSLLKIPINAHRSLPVCVITSVCIERKLYICGASLINLIFLSQRLLNFQCHQHTRSLHSIHSMNTKFYFFFTSCLISHLSHFLLCPIIAIIPFISRNWTS